MGQAVKDLYSNNFYHGIYNICVISIHAYSETIAVSLKRYFVS